MTHDDMTSDERELMQSLAALPVLEPLPGLEERLSKRIAEQANSRAAPRGWTAPAWTGWAIAAAVAIVLGSGWAIERRAHVRDADALQVTLVTALADLSAAKRLNAVNAAAEAGAGDSGIVMALTHVLLSDSSVSVRVAAARALGALASSTALADAAIRSAVGERSPFVQSALLTAASDHLSPERRAALAKALLARTDIESSIRVQAQQLTGS